MKTRKERIQMAFREFGNGLAMQVVDGVDVYIELGHLWDIEKEYSQLLCELPSDFDTPALDEYREGMHE